jgi:uncharacterized membrane-anchored protein YhcB (DUF1043 family)
VDLTWLWAAIAGLVCVVCGFVIYKFAYPALKERVRRRTEEALLNDMDDFNDF